MHIDTWTELFKTFGKPKKILEIGSFEGKSTCWMLDNTDANVTCVDTWDGSDEHTEDMKNGLYDRFCENISQYKDRVTIFRGQSGIILRNFQCTEEYDFVYIDGSHKSQDVLEDAVLSWRLVKPGGIIIFDDFLWKGGGDDLNSLENPHQGILAFVHIYKCKVVLQNNQLVIIK